MEKKITIKSGPLKFFMQYLTLINPLYKLAPKETEVLAYLLYLNYKYQDIPVEARNKIIFDYDSKVLISNEFDTSLAKVNNVFTVLRKKTFNKQSFILGKRLNLAVPYLPEIKDNKMTLTFNFTIQ